MEDVYVAAVHLNDSALVQAIWDTLKEVEEDHEASLASPQHLEAMRRLQVRPSGVKQAETVLRRVCKGF